MPYSRFTLLALLAVAACADIPEGAEVLTGDALAARVSGQAFEVSPPADSFLGEGIILRAELQPDGVANMSASENGKKIGLFEDTQQWSVQGQTLCISDGPEPKATDCIRVDWIQGNRMQITDKRPDGDTDVSIGTPTPL